MGTYTLIWMGNVIAELGRSSVTAVVSRGDKSSKDAASSNWVSHAWFRASVGLPVGAESDTCLFIKHIIASGPNSGWDISDEAVIDFDVHNWVQVDSNWLGANEVGTVNEDIPWGANVEGPRFRTVDHRVLNERQTSIASALKTNCSFESVLLSTVWNFDIAQLGSCVAGCAIELHSVGSEDVSTPVVFIRGTNNFDVSSQEANLTSHINSTVNIRGRISSTIVIPIKRFVKCEFTRTFLVVSDDSVLWVGPLKVCWGEVDLVPGNPIELSVDVSYALTFVNRCL